MKFVLAVLVVGVASAAVQKAEMTLPASTYAARPGHVTSLLHPGLMGHVGHVGRMGHMGYMGHLVPHMSGLGHANHHVVAGTPYVTNMHRAGMYHGGAFMGYPHMTHGGYQHIRTVV